ncbi:hypothetical protein MseVgp085 [Melanoplus sanguinipes entomopoxvirus]|uniref:Uncharacterized protein n=1 Tax=Melanoplus sanguinipes entomopoxvirus TaxID=83191 RepID=Q9YW07_MSEPV|nr:hypothetical protein MseVgp085 [Melanoplus sanguinipes entomopoxvirus]AAC97811.1 ORF MSV085 hypothetical protein [Melanoplus sanguinipes entomopoxvirus 'O']
MKVYIILIILVSSLIMIILMINYSQYESNILRKLSNEYLSSLIYEPLVLNEYKEGDINEIKNIVDNLIAQYNELLQEYQLIENNIKDLEIIIQENVDEIHFLTNEIDKLKENVTNLSI